MPATTPSANALAIQTDAHGGSFVNPDLPKIDDIAHASFATGMRPVLPVHAASRNIVNELTTFKRQHL